MLPRYRAKAEHIYLAGVKRIPPRGYRNTLMGFPEYWDGVYRALPHPCTLRGQHISLVALCATIKPSPGMAPPQAGTDMTGPSWLAVTFAAVVILAGGYSASRLAISRLRGRATEFDADALHAIMGAAMAGMLVPRLSVLPDGAWIAVFGVAAAWFGWRTMRTRGPAAAAISPSRYPAPHLIECAAMLYMLLPVRDPHPAHAGAGVAMAGMGVSAGPSGSFPALAIVLALFMLGYMVWTTDRLASLARARIAAAGPGRRRGRRSPAAVPVAVTAHAAGDAPGTPAAGTRRSGRAGGPVLTPGLATCGRLAMSIAMGYMLILMF